MTSQSAIRTSATLEMADLDNLVDAARADGQPLRLFSALDALAARVIGHTLFTIMMFDARRFEVERLYSSMPDVYPVGGRKKKASTAWGEHTLVARKVCRTNDAAGIRTTFDDHETLSRLGIGAILNIPVAYDGRCVGTMNLSHREGWFTADDERVGLLLGSFLAAPLAVRQSLQS